MTIEEIKASNKKEVHPQMNYHDLLEWLMIFASGNDIFFREFSVGSQSLWSLLLQMEHYKSTFKAMGRLDKEFPSKFLMAVNKRYQIWLKECKISLGRTEVNDLIINFSSIVLQVLFGTFHMDLNPSVKMIAQEKNTSQKGGKHLEQKPGDNKQGKKKGKNGDDSQDLIKNKHPLVKLCMLANETWAINFATRTLTSTQNGEKRADAAHAGSSTGTVSSTAKTKRATSRPTRSQQQLWPK